MDGVAPNAVAAVSEARQWDRLMEMAKLGAIPGDGVNRACLTDLDRQARRLLLGWGTALGLSPSVDALGNLFLRHEGTEAGAAPVLTGSHMDTQPNGGRFDGIWGVIAGLEAVQAILDSGVKPKRPIEVVAWTNEEGGRFAPGCMGSMAWAGFKPADSWDAVADKDGITWGDALRELRRGLALQRLHRSINGLANRTEQCRQCGVIDQAGIDLLGLGSVNSDDGLQMRGATEPPT